MKMSFIKWLLFIPFITFANTKLPSDITESQTLSLASSPYQIEASLSIAEGITLKLEAGVVLLLDKDCGINNYGQFIVEGTTEAPVIFRSNTADEKWNWINNYGTLKLSHVISSDAKRFVSCTGDSLIIDHCKVYNTTGNVAGYDAIGAHYTPYIRLTNSTLFGDTTDTSIDAIDLDGVHDVIIAHNTIRNFSDDAIDIGTNSSGVVINNNYFTNCSMGISVGETSTVSSSHNLIVACDAGIQSHTNSVLTVDYSTLYDNDYGVIAYHYTSQPTSTGTAIITNTIISKCNSESTPKTLMFS